MEIKYSTKLYNIYKMSIPIVAIIIATWLFMIMFDEYLSSTTQGIVLGAMFFGLIFFGKLLRNVATRRAMIVFEDTGIEICEYSLNKDILQATIVIEWRQIDHYRYYRTKDSVNHIVLVLRDGQFKDLGVQDGKSIEETLGNDGIVGIFHSYIKAYNSKNVHQIELQSGLLSTKIGKAVFLFMGICMPIAFVIHLFVAPKTSFATLFLGGVFYLSAYASKKNSEKIFKMIKNLDTV